MPLSVQKPKAYICEDCIFIFVVYQKVQKKKPFCPNCGENHSVSKHSSVKKDGKENIQVTYTPDEDVMVWKYVNQELTKAQVAYLLGRTTGSVRARANRLKNKEMLT